MRGATLLFDGSINAATFEAYTELCLAPSLRPGDAVVLDNLAAYMSPGVETCDGGRGCDGLVAAAVLARPEPDREALEQDQDVASAGRRGDAEWSRASRRRCLRDHRSGRVRQILPFMWSRHVIPQAALRSSESCLNTFIEPWHLTCVEHVDEAAQTSRDKSTTPIR